MDREPCPWRIVDDAGGAFTFGKSRYNHVSMNVISNRLMFVSIL